MIDRFGADALRWYFFTSKQPWDGYRFSLETIGEAVRQFLLQLWNTYGFYVLYANANGIDHGTLAKPRRHRSETELDRWALSRLQATIEVVRDRMDHFDATEAGRAIQTFVDDISNWYVRRSRRRFWDGDPAAFATLRTCLLTTAKLLAPFCPFIADEIYDNLDGSEPSVHLCDFPTAGARDQDLEHAMATARETVRLGLAARGQAKIAVRRPLRAAVVVATGEEREAIERMSEIVREELNVQRAAVRLRGRRARRGRAQAELPHARSPLRQAHAARRGRGRRARRRQRGRGDPARRAATSRSRSTARTTSSPPTTCRSR